MFDWLSHVDDSPHQSGRHFDVSVVAPVILAGAEHAQPLFENGPGSLGHRFYLGVRLGKAVEEVFHDLLDRGRLVSLRDLDDGFVQEGGESIFASRHEIFGGHGVVSFHLDLVAVLFLQSSLHDPLSRRL